MEVKVRNIVSNIKLDQDIDLENLAQAPGMEYNPHRFAGVIYRIHEFKNSFLIFEGGKMILAGPKSREEIKIALGKMKEKFKEVGVEINFPSVEIQNLVASANLNFKVNIDMLALECKNTEYVPEQFPGLIFRLHNPETVALIFKSGKIVIAGAKTFQEAENSAQKTKKIIKEAGCVIQQDKL